MTSKNRIAYGPVPSRRLGRSMGINNIPSKFCSYSCVYCQLGRTKDLTIERRRFHGPDRVFQDVEAQVASVEEMGGRIDHLTFVPDGEPTLDIDLGKEIEMVKGLGYPVAVITNSSLLGHQSVREELSGADLVSVKVDAVDEGVWRKVNRPHGSLVFNDIKEGLKKFSNRFKGSLITETMLVKGINDAYEIVEGTAEFISELEPKIAYISVPIRPPSEEWAVIPSDESIMRIIANLASRRTRTVPLVERELGDFTYTGDIKEDLLAITSVHPMRKDSVVEMIERAGAGWDIVEGMVRSGELASSEYMGCIFYRRALY
ncbi:MAG: radical SAM protein [Candidatus Thermoplasmatota archaeon]|nr:radical SAM protein [Candidatus Thermoplasmatota archaeon]